MLKDLRFHLTAKSGNAKTGPIAVSTSSKATCSPSCPFLGHGCYANAVPLHLHWQRVTNGERGVPFTEFLQQLKSLPIGSYYRHNQAGDLVHNAGKISRTFIRKMVDATRHLVAFTYTHHNLALGENLQLLRFANRNGFRINVSCETERQVDSTIAAGLPAVVVANSAESRTQWRTEQGNIVLVCPAQRNDDTTCADCMLCHKRGARVAIAFLAHGTAKNKVNAKLSEVQ